jgi:hypothetical protein
MTEPNAWRLDMLELKAVLTAATRVRHLREEFVAGELGWVRHERNIMHDATNAIRARYGRPPVTREQIEAVESRAGGHIDYVSKYAIGCADLVHAEPTGEEKP